MNMHPTFSALFRTREVSVTLCLSAQCWSLVCLRVCIFINDLSRSRNFVVQTAVHTVTLIHSIHYLQMYVSSRSYVYISYIDWEEFIYIAYICLTSVSHWYILDAESSLRLGVYLASIVHDSHFEVCTYY